MKINKSQEQKKQLMQTIFRHITNLPEKQIKESVILVSFTDDHKYAFQKITGRIRTSNDRFPLLFTLEDGTKLIDSTSQFLKPEVDYNFVTMHYIMKIVERAKFIFVLNSSETSDMPFDNIKQMLTRFISMLKIKDETILQNLIESCGILITEANCDLNSYSKRLAGKDYNQNLLDKEYMPNQYKNVRIMVKKILESNRVLLSPASQKNKLITSQFIKFIKQLNYFTLAGNVDLKLQSAYQQFVECEIFRLWHQVFKNLYDNIDVIALDKNMRKQKQKSIYQLITAFDFDKRNREQQRQEQQLPQQEFKSLKLLKIMDSMIKIIMKFIDDKIINMLDLESNKEVVKEVLEILYSNNLIQNSFIRIFLINYFLIRKFLSKEEEMDNTNTDLFHRVGFCEIVRNTETFHSKMREITIVLLRELQSDLAVVNKQFPSNECLNLLNQILNQKDKPEFTFFTDRVTKKLLKFRAIIAYNIVKKSQKNKKQMLRSELNFLKWSVESKLIKDKLKTEIFIDIALVLAENKNLVKLALQILKMLPQYEIFNHVRYIYEKQLNLNVEVLRYLPEDQRKELLHQHFQGYFTFFLKIGFQQTVRQMSLECLRLSDNEEDREYFKNALIKARGNGFRDLHNSFLENSILQEKQVIIGQDFIAHIQQKMKENGLI